jgi:hypothetical protein
MVKRNLQWEFYSISISIIVITINISSYKLMIEEWSPTEWKLEMTDRRQNCAVVTLVLPR